jgi:hypothetical protein
VPRPPGRTTATGPELECRITTPSGFHGAECPPVVAANPESGERHVGAGPPAAVPHGTAMPDVDRAHAPQAVDELDRDRALTDHGRHALHGSVADVPDWRTPEAGLQRQREATERRERVGTQIRSGQDEAIGITLDGRGSHSVCGRAPIIRKSAPALTFSTPWPARSHGTRCSSQPSPPPSTTSVPVRTSTLGPRSAGPGSATSGVQRRSPHDEPDASGVVAQVQDGLSNAARSPTTYTSSPDKVGASAAAAPWTAPAPRNASRGWTPRRR